MDVGERVRMREVDTPELNQLQLVVGKPVNVRPAGHSYRPLVVGHFRSGGTDVAAVLLTTGAAWVEP